MRLVVLGSTQSWYYRDLCRAAGQRHQIIPATFRELVASIDPEQLRLATGDIDLHRADCILVRTMPPGSLEQVVVRMDVLGELARGGIPVVNAPRAIETAVDKYLATAGLYRAGLPVPATCVCQGWEEAMQAFARLGSDVVVKPLFGSEGRGITRVNDEAIALRVFKTLEQLQAVIYLQEYIEHHGHDLRLLVIGRQVLGMRRSNPLDWRTNVSRGARTEPVEVTPELGELAFRAADAIGARLAGVDLLPARDGRLLALEVNAVPGWKALAGCLKVDVAALVLDYLQRQVEGTAE